MAETTSPSVVPVLTKTDARELKSLVKNDTGILLEGLDYRLNDFVSQIHEQSRVKETEIAEERERRDIADAKAAKAAMAAIRRRVVTLNKAIVETLTDLSEAGWTVNYGRYDAKNIDPHRHTLGMDDPMLHPPTRDDSDLDEQLNTLREQVSAADQAVNQAHQAARRETETKEAQMLRDLTLQSITTESAREFILNMPDVENLLPAPVELTAIEG